jgi:hypothetical protein
MIFDVVAVATWLKIRSATAISIPSSSQACVLKVVRRSWIVWIGAEPGPRDYAEQALGFVKKSHFWRGFDRRGSGPPLLEILEQLAFFSSDIMGSHFGAYPHPIFQDAADEGPGRGLGSQPRGRC